MITVQHLYKSFGSTNVLSDVSLSLASSQIHAVLGPNGSGKSTLARCLSGAIRPDSGALIKDSVEHEFFTPRSAREAGIAVIYQTFSLVESLTVADNIFLGDEIHTPLGIKKATQRAIVAEQLRRFGRKFDPDAPVKTLSTGDRQIVEIVKALRRAPSVLILDEPTAALGHDEIVVLAATLRALRDEGMAIMYVTHAISEVFAIADFVTVLRDGSVALSQSVGTLTPRAVIRAIAPSSHEDQPGSTGSERSRSDGLTLESFTTPGISTVDLCVGAGEVVGVFGLLGSGRTELLEAIYGIRPRAGTIEVGGREHEGHSPAAALRAGIALVPGDRLRQGMFPRLTALDNLLLPHYRRLARFRLRNRTAERREFAGLAEHVKLSPRSPDRPARIFSGGNQQKLVVCRWLASGSALRVLLLDEPTQGIDVGARQDLYRLLRHLAKEEGKAVLFTSSDPDETLALADRILVLRAGAVQETLDRSEATPELLLDHAHASHHQ